MSQRVSLSGSLDIYITNQSGYADDDINFARIPAEFDKEEQSRYACREVDIGEPFAAHKSTGYKCRAK
ncbi:predicted protein [Botrytis cinerea T4]|uniref:Uncharacterized protein n=1 Tax=Botryotinia fuckeliana (strain T4) TaxID=999810 RepID=G2Y0U9_BOTF4|nr:predicted protein [Botrytis cinerea T4]